MEETQTKTEQEEEHYPELLVWWYANAPENMEPEDEQITYYRTVCSVQEAVEVLCFLRDYEEFLYENNLKRCQDPELKGVITGGLLLFNKETNEYEEWKGDDGEDIVQVIDMMSDEMLEGVNNDS